MPSLREKVEGPAAIRDALQALAWYAERRNYLPPAGGGSYDALTATDSYDGEGPGARARAALERLDAVRTGR